MVGTFEYEITLSGAKTGKDMEFVATAFHAGQNKVLSLLSNLADDNGNVSINILEIYNLLSKDIKND